MHQCCCDLSVDSLPQLSGIAGFPTIVDIPSASLCLSVDVPAVADVPALVAVLDVLLMQYLLFFASLLLLASLLVSVAILLTFISCCCWRFCFYVYLSYANMKHARLGTTITVLIYLLFTIGISKIGGLARQIEKTRTIKRNQVFIFLNIGL
jgi:hypothetical protein